MSWELPYGEVQISQNPNDYPFRAADYDPYLLNRLIASFSLAAVSTQFLTGIPLSSLFPGWRTY